MNAARRHPKTARHHEIAQRYRRGKPPVSELERILAWRRPQLVRLFEYRGGLHDDGDGRANLRLLLELGLTGPDATTMAPWLAPGELQTTIDDINRWPPQCRTADALGNRVELTFEEKIWVPASGVDGGESRRPGPCSVAPSTLRIPPRAHDVTSLGRFPRYPRIFLLHWWLLRHITR